MTADPENSHRLDDVAKVLWRALDEVALCRRIVAQARDQFIAAEIAADRAREAASA